VRYQHPKIQQATFSALLGAKHVPMHVPMCMSQCRPCIARLAGWPHSPLAIAPRVPKAMSDQSSDVAWLQKLYTQSSCQTASLVCSSGGVMPSVSSSSSSSRQFAEQRHGTHLNSRRNETGLYTKLLASSACSGPRETSTTGSSPFLSVEAALTAAMGVPGMMPLTICEPQPKKFIFPAVQQLERAVSTTA
jgi:hypothetical protein